MVGRKYLEVITKHLQHKQWVRKNCHRMIVLFEVGPYIQCYEDDAMRLYEVVGVEIEKLGLYTKERDQILYAKFEKKLLREYLDEIKCSQYAATVVVGL